MELYTLDEDSIELFGDFIPMDIAENINRRYYRGMVVTGKGQPVAGMIWEIRKAGTDKGRESHISWLVLSDEESGNFLLDEYKKRIEKEDVVRSTFSLSAKTGKQEKAFLSEQGFSAMLMEGDLIDTKLSEVLEMSFIRKTKISSNILSLSAISQRGFKVAIKRLVQKGLYGICEDIEYLPRMHFENDVSCYCEEDGTVVAIFLCHLTASGKILIELMTSIGAKYTKLIPQLITKAVLSAKEKYGGDIESLIDRHNYATLALGEKLFPSGFGQPMFIGSRKEK